MARTVKTLMPTRKWWVAQATAVGSWLVAAINAGWEIHESLQIMAVGIVVEAVATWLTPNANTPAGVPRETVRHSKR